MPEADPQPTPEADLATLRQQLEQANQRLIQAELKAHAIRAGLIDLDCLKLLDTAKLRLNEDGTLADGETALTDLKRDKPWFFAKSAPAQSSSQASPPPKPAISTTPNAKTMSHEEWQAARARLLKGF